MQCAGALWVISGQRCSEKVQGDFGEKRRGCAGLRRAAALRQERNVRFPALLLAGMLLARSRPRWRMCSHEWRLVWPAQHPRRLLW